MSHIFRIGDRVRIVYSNGWPELNGTEGRIASVLQNNETTNGLITQGYEIEPSLWGSIWAPRRGKFGGNVFFAKPDQLEPLNPPKSQISEILAMQELPDCDVADLLRKHEREGISA